MAADTVELNVRCCCTPRKVFGVMTLPVQVVHMVGKAATVRLPTKDGGSETVKLRMFTQYLPNGMYRTELAVYSDDRPAAYWKRFYTYKEAPHG